VFEAFGHIVQFVLNSYQKIYCTVEQMVAIKLNIFHGLFTRQWLTQFKIYFIVDQIVAIKQDIFHVPTQFKIYPIVEQIVAFLQNILCTLFSRLWPTQLKIYSTEEQMVAIISNIFCPIYQARANLSNNIFHCITDCGHHSEYIPCPV
jgi:hypothetical protein